MIVDFRKWQREQPPIHIDGIVVEKVESFKFLAVHIINSKHKHFATLALTSANHVYVTNTFDLI